MLVFLFVDRGEKRVVLWGESAIGGILWVIQYKSACGR